MAPYYEPEGGGLERYAHAVLSRLAARGHDVHALAFTRGPEGREMRDGVRLERVAPLLRLRNTPLHPALRARITRRLRELAPDVVVAHTPVPFAAEMAFAAARREGIPFVPTYHAGRLRGSSPFTERLAALDRATLERRMLIGSDHIIAVSAYVRDHALVAHRERVTVVPPGVDGRRFAPDGTRGARDVLFVGPLDTSYRWKGIDVLIAAFRGVLRERPDARLVVVGDGDRSHEIRNDARDLGGAVRLVGRVSDAILISLYQGSAVTVLPSITDAESFGMVLAEANACGCPVVGSDIGGIPYFVRHRDNGLLARAGDADDLAEKITMILEDREMARDLGKRGRDRVLREHDWDHVTARTERVLQHAVAVAAK